MKVRTVVFRISLVAALFLVVGSFILLQMVPK